MIGPSARFILTVLTAATVGVAFGGTGVACKSTSSDASTTGPSLSGITPPIIFPNRTTQVTITGAGTTFTGQPTVDLRDPNIKVTNVVVKSPTSLTATLESSEAASLGPHDVVVGVVGDSITLRGGLTLAAPIQHEIGGSTQPGSVIAFALTNIDKDNPFVGPAPTFVSGAAIIDYTEVSAMRVVGTAVVDALAPVGPLVLRLTTRNAKGETITFATHAEDPLAPKVTEVRAATALATGTPLPPDTLSLPRQTKLYKVAVPDDAQVFFMAFGAIGESLRTINSTRLMGLMAPTSGKFGEGSPFDTVYDFATSTRVGIGIAPKGDAYFAIHTSDLTGGAAGYGYTPRTTIAKGTGFSTKEPAAPDSGAAPLASVSLDGPVFSTDGAIDSAGDADYIAFTAKKAGRVFVQAAPLTNKGAGMPNVSLFGNNCSVYISGGTGSGVAMLTATIGTTYCARIDATGPLTMGYQLVVSPEL